MWKFAWAIGVDALTSRLCRWMIIPRMEFFDSVKAIPILFANSMCIVGERKDQIVPLTRGDSKIKTMSAMQLSKGVPIEIADENAKPKKQTTGCEDVYIFNVCCQVS